MSERVQAYFAKLAKLSNEELDRSACALSAHEKHDIAQLIAHIAEIADRDYHLERRYKSLFEYCVDRLNLGENTVGRRMQVASVCRKYPAILEEMSRGRLNLTGASLIASHLTDDNFERLIAAALGKTKRQIEALLVTFAPKKPFEPSIRKQPASDPAPERGGDVPPLPQGRPDGGAPKAPPRNILQPATEDRFNVRFSAGRAFTEKLERLAEVLGITCPRNHLEQILTRALDIALEKKDPQRKLERKRRREARKESPAQEKATVSPREEETRPEAKPHGSPSRHVPADVRARVLERAGYRCEYRGPDGARCTCRTGLQVEHVRPFGVYRSHDEEYLRAFCPAHNQFAARRYYGREFMEQKIEAARRKRQGERSLHGQSGVPESMQAAALPRGAPVNPG